MIAHIMAAAKSKLGLSGVIVLTKDTNIAEITKQNGTVEPLLRPAGLAQDTTTTPQVLQQAVTTLAIRENCHPDKENGTTCFKRQIVADNILPVLMEPDDNSDHLDDFARMPGILCGVAT